MRQQPKNRMNTSCFQLCCLERGRGGKQQLCSSRFIEAKIKQLGNQVSSFGKGKRSRSRSKTDPGEHCRLFLHSPRWQHPQGSPKAQLQLPENSSQRIPHPSSMELKSRGAPEYLHLKGHSQHVFSGQDISPVPCLPSFLIRACIGQVGSERLYDSPRS